MEAAAAAAVEKKPTAPFPALWSVWSGNTAF
jgi:hypothetical protein